MYIMNRATGNGTAVFGNHDDNTLAQIDSVANNAEYSALMPDGHLGFTMPIGGIQY